MSIGQNHLTIGHCSGRSSPASRSHVEIDRSVQIQTYSSILSARRSGADYSLNPFHAEEFSKALNSGQAGAEAGNIRDSVSVRECYVQMCSRGSHLHLSFDLLCLSLPVLNSNLWNLLRSFGLSVTVAWPSVDDVVVDELWC